MTHLLDTDHITFLQLQDGAEWAVLVGHIQRVSQQNVAVSVISFHEQVMGVHKQLNRARRPPDLPRWYRRMGELFDLYSKTNLVLFDDSAVAVLEVLRKTPKLRIKPMDLRIAAVALSQNLVLVTRNVRDFGKVPGLRTEDWTK